MKESTTEKLDRAAAQSKPERVHITKLSNRQKETLLPVIGTKLVLQPNKDNLRKVVAKVSSRNVGKLRFTCTVLGKHEVSSIIDPKTGRGVAK